MRLAAPDTVVVQGQQQNIRRHQRGNSTPQLDRPADVKNMAVGYVTPVFYQTVKGSDRKTIGAMGCDDITEGNNNTAAAGGYSARSGYDAVTGWGSPKGAALAEALSTQSALV
jgi:hypothetical protein